MQQMLFFKARAFSGEQLVQGGLKKGGPRLREHASAGGLGLVADEHNDLREPLGFFCRDVETQMEVRDSRNLVHDFLTSLSPLTLLCSFLSGASRWAAARPRPAWTWAPHTGWSRSESTGSSCRRRRRRKKKKKKRKK